METLSLTSRFLPARERARASLQLGLSYLLKLHWPAAMHLPRQWQGRRPCMLSRAWQGCLVTRKFFVFVSSFCISSGAIAIAIAIDGSSRWKSMMKNVAGVGVVMIMIYMFIHINDA
eukprot:scaffold3767_cov116-Skeletonema_menzelii.AAC.13